MKLKVILLLNKAILFMSWRRSAIKEVNDWGPTSPFGLLVRKTGCSSNKNAFTWIQQQLWPLMRPWPIVRNKGVAFLNQLTMVKTKLWRHGHLGYFKKPFGWVLLMMQWRESKYKLEIHRGLKSEKSAIQWIGSTHAPPKGWKCHVFASYQMWFCQKLLKNAKNHSKIVKIWPFLWKATSGSAEIHNFRFLAFLSNFWPKMATIVVKTPSTQNEKKSNRSLSAWLNFWQSRMTEFSWGVPFNSIFSLVNDRVKNTPKSRFSSSM